MINYKEANQISIKAYLASLNIHPAKERNYYGMYHSPFREDRNASMKVDYNKNLWIDYGTGEGGTAIDLVMTIENCSFQTAIAALERIDRRTNEGIYDSIAVGMHKRIDSRSYCRMDANTYAHQYNNTTDTFFFHRNNDFVTNSTPREPAINIRQVVKIAHPALLDYLKERGIREDIAQRQCVEIHYTVNDKPYYALGFENNNGGYELRSRYFKGCTSKDISSRIDHGRENRDSNLSSENCLLFEGFMDYLSFLTIQEKEPQRQIPTLAPADTSTNISGDVIILNSLTNLSKAVDILAKYKSVSLFLDNDDAGQKAVRELQTTCRNVEDRSLLYRGCKDLNEYLCKKRLEHKCQAAQKQHRHRL
jgi:hypothetical protein